MNMSQHNQESLYSLEHEEQLTISIVALCGCGGGSSSGDCGSCSHCCCYGGGGVCGFSSRTATDMISHYCGGRSEKDRTDGRRGFPDSRCGKNK